MFRSRTNCLDGDQYLCAQTGRELDNKTILVGVSPNTGNQFILSGLLRSDWVTANQMAPRISSRYVSDMRMASQQELEVLHAARDMGALAEKFEDIASRGHGWMWSGDTIHYATQTAWVKSLSHGGVAGHHKEERYIVPLVKDL